MKKNQIFDFFPVNFYDGDTSFSSQNFFSQAEISYESKGVPNESFGKTHRAKKTEMSQFPQSIRNLRQFHMIKSNKEITLKTRETCFLYRKPQKRSIAKKCYSKSIFKKIIEIFLFSVSRIVPEKVASYRRKNE